MSSPARDEIRKKMSSPVLEKTGHRRSRVSSGEVPAGSGWAAARAPLLSVDMQLKYGYATTGYLPLGSCAVEHANLF